MITLRTTTTILRQSELTTEQYTYWLQHRSESTDGQPAPYVHTEILQVADAGNGTTTRVGYGRAEQATGRVFISIEDAEAVHTEDRTAIAQQYYQDIAELTGATAQNDGNAD